MSMRSGIVRMAGVMIVSTGMLALPALAGGGPGYGGPFGFGRVPHEARFMSSIWGTRDQLGELVTLAQQHTLHSTIEVIGLAEAQNAHERLHAGDVSGRFVIVPGDRS